MISSAKDRRIAQRYTIGNERVGHVDLEGHPKGIIGDISYGGLAVTFVNELDPITHAIPERTTISLCILGERIDASVTRVYASPRLAGFAFCHETTDVLIFLREVLENMRCGSTLRTIDSTLLKDRYAGKGWHCFQGEGPTDFRAHVDPADGSIVEALLTMRDRGVYHELAYRNGKFVTSISVDEDGVSSRMSPTPHLDPGILRQGLASLIGLAGGHFQGPTGAFISLALDELNKTTRQAKAS